MYMSSMGKFTCKYCGAHLPHPPHPHISDNPIYFKKPISYPDRPNLLFNVAIFRTLQGHFRPNTKRKVFTNCVFLVSV